MLLPSDDAPAGCLADGTPYYGELGEVAYDPDEDKVQCHLCGAWRGWVSGTHLSRLHGWTLGEYRAAFGLTKRQPLMSAGMLTHRRAWTIARIKAGEINLRHMAETGAEWRSLAELHPRISGRVAPGPTTSDRDPAEFGCHSQHRAWWRCASCGHEWRAAIRDRAAGRGCPVCALAAAAARAALPRAGSLAELRPDLVAELHPTRNGNLDPHPARCLVGALGLVAVPCLWPRVAGAAE